MSAYKWVLIAMLSGAFFFHQADRALFGLLTIPIQKELLLSDTQIGWINTTLSWTLAAMTVVAGFLGDRCSRKWIITISLIAWSLMTVCMGFIGGFLGALFFRSIATGVGESFYAPSAYALIATHHKSTRSLALSIHQSSLYIGLMLSGVIVAWALGFLGSWRNVFIAFGVAGMMLGIVFIFALKERGAERVVLSVATNATIPDSQGGTSSVASDALTSRTANARLAIKAYFGNPSALLATAGFVAIVFVNNAYLFWAPKYMVAKFTPEFEQMLQVSASTKEGLEAIVGKAGAMSMLYHHLLALVAILIGGVVTDCWVRKLPRFRLGFQILALLAGAPCLLMIGDSSSLTTMVVMTAAYGVFRGFFEVNTHASLFDVVPPEHRSTAVGLLNMIAFFFGGLSGVVMGWLSDKYGVRGFEHGFALMAGAYAFAAMLMAISFFFTFKRDRVLE